MTVVYDFLTKQNQSKCLQAPIEDIMYANQPRAVIVINNWFFFQTNPFFFVFYGSQLFNLTISFKLFLWQIRVDNHLIKGLINPTLIEWALNLSFINACKITSGSYYKISQFNITFNTYYDKFLFICKIIL